MVRTQAERILPAADAVHHSLVEDRNILLVAHTGLADDTPSVAAPGSTLPAVGRAVGTRAVYVRVPAFRCVIGSTRIEQLMRRRRLVEEGSWVEGRTFAVVVSPSWDLWVVVCF